MTVNGNSKDFLGTGWCFPPMIDSAGEFATVAHEEDIRQAIRIILGTSPGERVMRTDFGAGLKDFVFEPVNTTTMTLIQHRVEEALLRWEPRIDLKTVSVSPDGRLLYRLLIHISYRVRSTNKFDNLVYPFYLAQGGRA